MFSFSTLYELDIETYTTRTRILACSSGETTPRLNYALVYEFSI